MSAERERHDDPLVESCLDEILGGKTPPDLKSDIMRRVSDENEAHVVPPPFQLDTEDVQRPVIQPLARSINGRTARTRVANRSGVQRYAWIVTGGVVVCLLAFVIYSANSKDNQLAQPPTTDNTQTELPPAPPPEPEIRQPEIPDDPVRDESNESVESDELVPDEPAPETPLEQPKFAEDPLTDEQLVALINQGIQQQWDLAKIQPTGPIDDTTWCQRVFQRLLGRSMTEDEVRSFERWQPKTDKRSALIKFVFDAPKYKNEFATYWGQFWSDRLLARAHPRDAKSFRRSLARYLGEQLKESPRHDVWVKSLLEAEGSNMLSEADHNGATNFLLGLRDKDGVLPATEVCRVLLGRRVQCAQCHNDGQAGLTQDQFWQLTAFFQQMEVTGYGPGRGRLSRLEKARPVSFERSDGNRQQVEPRFFAADDSEAPYSDDRRADLARLITESDLFARATVNRVWSHLLGYGFTSPVDDMGHRNPSSHPALLDQLADEFAKADFDTQRLIRWIVLSEPFNRSGVIAVSDKSDIPEISFVAFFSRYYHRSALFTTPDEAIVSLGSSNPQQLAGMVPERVFGQRQDSFDDDEESQDSGEVDASQIGLANQLTIGQLRLARSLAKSRMSSEEKLRHAFLAVMARFPTDREMKQAMELHTAKDNEIQAMENLIWALTRTQEFVNEH